MISPYRRSYCRSKLESEVLPTPEELRQHLEARLLKAIQNNNFNEIEIYKNLLQGKSLLELSQEGEKYVR